MLGFSHICSFLSPPFNPAYTFQSKLQYTFASAAKSLQSCLTLCDPMDCSLPGSSARGILQARILEWVAMPSSRASSWPRGHICVSRISCIGRQVFTAGITWEPPILLVATLNISHSTWLQSLEFIDPSTFLNKKMRLGFFSPNYFCKDSILLIL